MFERKWCNVIHLYPHAHVADPAHLIVASVPAFPVGGPVYFSGTRWQRLLVWLLAFSIERELQRDLSILQEQEQKPIPGF